MQWLIDIVAEAVEAQLGIPPCFVDRGDPGAADFNQGNIIADGFPHDLDFSAIVPDGATAMTISIIVRSFAIQNFIFMYTKGNVNLFNSSSIWTQVALIEIAADFIVPL
ncbi:hypothetical protein KAR91_10815, partial [Candidatus Pacearchaeota archaeon]|nr:hypothetical protein [Candidatus Pacearchaeota archaeon]